jgi:hypothetical protein
MFAYIMRLKKPFMYMPGGVTAGERTDHSGMKALKPQHIHPGLIRLKVVVERTLGAKWPHIGLQTAMVDHARVHAKSGTEKRCPRRQARRV